MSPTHYRVGYQTSRSNGATHYTTVQAGSDNEARTKVRLALEHQDGTYTLTSCVQVPAPAPRRPQQTDQDTLNEDIPLMRQLLADLNRVRDDGQCVECGDPATLGERCEDHAWMGDPDANPADVALSRRLIGYHRSAA